MYSSLSSPVSMPVFELNTNVLQSKITKDFLKSTSKVIAKTLGKPESYVVIQVNPDRLILWGGSDEPCGFANLTSIGQLGIQENKKHAAAISEHLDKHLGIPRDRLYIHFIDAPASDMGYNNTTFHEIFGGR